MMIPIMGSSHSDIVLDCVSPEILRVQFATIAGCPLGLRPCVANVFLGE